MNMPQQPGWIARIFVTLITLALVVLGFFFLTVALIAGAIVAAVICARLWWAVRKLKRALAAANVGAEADPTIVAGEYRVIERENTGARLPPQP